MGTREVSSVYRGLIDDGQQLHRVWELDVLGNILLLERYGSMCGWNQIKLKKNGAEVYRIVKPWSCEERTEFFFNQLTRSYMGDKFSFVEYIDLIVEQERFLESQEYVQAGLDVEVEKQYRNNLQKILDAKT